MEREIKFRGKRIDNGEWVYGSYQPFVGEAEMMIFFDISGKRNHEYKKVQIDRHLITEIKMPDYQGWDYSSQIRYIEVKPETIGQFTGFEDKNGVEIYGGDIIRFCDDPPYCYDYTVKYDEERLIWIADGVNDFTEDLWELGCGFVGVIGNIYDDSESLKDI